MNRFKILALCISCACCLNYEAKKSLSVPQFDINLDLPPRKRWETVAESYKDVLPFMMDAFKKAIHKKIPPTRLHQWAGIAREIDVEFQLELQGYMDVVRDERVTMKLLLYMQMLYEMGSPTMCSGVLAAKADGTVIHGRNMDYRFPFKVADGTTMNWPDVTFDVIYYKGGQKLMTSTNWPGRVGMNTAMRYDGWSFSENTRSIHNNEARNLLAGLTGGVVYGLHLRKIMEKVPDFETALKSIHDSEYMATFYIIMAGKKPYEGAVLTIDRKGSPCLLTPPIQRLQHGADTWHLVQTNDDLTLPPLDSRRHAGNRILNSGTQAEVSSESVAQVLHASPIYGSSTVFSWVAIPATGEHATSLYDASQTYDSKGGSLGALKLLGHA